MYAYLYEPREERREGLSKELATVGIKVVKIDDSFFSRDLRLLNNDSQSTQAFLLSASEQLIDQISGLRAAGCDNPIIVIRDFRNSAETAKALDKGADQEMVVPIKGLELRARVNAIVRRANGHSGDLVQVGEVTAFFDGRDPVVSGKRVKLSRREHAIFNELAMSAGRVVSKASIYDAVYGLAEVPPFDKVVDVYICKIRKKLDASAPSGGRYIETVPGRGYRLSDDAFQPQITN